MNVHPGVEIVSLMYSKPLKMIELVHGQFESNLIEIYNLWQQVNI